MSDVDIVDNVSIDGSTSSDGTDSSIGSNNNNNIIQTTVDDSGKSMTITITRPLTSFPPLDEVWTDAGPSGGTGGGPDDPFGGILNVCGTASLEPDQQLVRPGLSGDAGGLLSRPGLGDEADTTFPDDSLFVRPSTRNKGGLMFTRPEDRGLLKKDDESNSQSPSINSMSSISAKNDLHRQFFQGKGMSPREPHDSEISVKNEEEKLDVQPNNVDAVLKYHDYWSASFARRWAERTSTSHTTLTLQEQQQQEQEQLDRRTLQEMFVEDFCLSITLGDGIPDDAGSDTSPSPTAVPEPEGLIVCHCDENNVCIDPNTLQMEEDAEPIPELQADTDAASTTVDEQSNGELRICIISPPNDPLVDISFFQVDDPSDENDATLVIPFIPEDKDFDWGKANMTSGGLIIHPNATHTMEGDGSVIVISYPIDGGIEGGDTFEVSGLAVFADSEGKFLLVIRHFLLTLKPNFLIPVQNHFK